VDPPELIKCPVVMPQYIIAENKKKKIAREIEQECRIKPE
jgi:hypothetical protein